MPKFKFMEMSPTGDSHNSVRKYNIIMKKELTVREFINEILSNTGEWGDISLKPENNLITHPRNIPVYKYRDGKLLSDLPDDVAEKHVKSAFAVSGYTCADYVITHKLA